MTAIAPTLDLEAARHAMVVSQLRTSGVNDARVVAAMAQVEREQFLPESQRPFAYRDRSLPLGNGRAQNPPLATGLLLTQAQIAPSDAILVIGAAGGYTAAVAAKLGTRVVAVETDPGLASAARVALGGTVTVVEAPLTVGAPDLAPYDVLIVDGAIEALPDSLAEQVKVGGRIVAGLVDRGVTRLAAGVRTEAGFGLVDFLDSDCAILPGFERPSVFEF
ncbi:protein-L-isoaspartate O-methyltransferase family protein [Sphingomonas turrisvirgatae]|uniref:Protein-L-isoaspartate O-methyltransferase n=1 Tax=Sphingomonas turrisvirgatae TaxID=1888892 RepID=A0A1E3LR62_9SPHN|nr:protein-L-isoaspartate O-methyltransferase [Sphingomonas turrisvirgatae]ODP36236.1 protein-L-isoaspartate O-methyltransferase [Sphingomonas turrisvirgatae]